MKKFLSVTLIVIMVLTVFAACSNKDKSTTNPSQSQVPTNTKDSYPSAENSTNTNTPDKDNLIGEDKAKEIALEKSGLTSQDVVFERTELEMDNGIWEYEIEFRQGTTEYSADIKADDGTIISFEKEIDD